ncbi:hypothetical protein [Roseisolibacter sp. H3M3-2]|uniref:hypothetical protein n=1 Tax=Roseisolibacter sp. H3M3-2 TaxID=3031323 RepID=UPI0023DC1E2D|nr:hypothetical protein [Roseisolibacter sp. H3M3-2]MDF1503637.1 hypothetical protein [Roseisolibacter sp. H3M3-2]
MSSAAALTLQIACFLQTDDAAPASPREWVLVPGIGGGVLTFDGAAARLDALEKPVVVGALDHPGYLAVWRPGAVDDAERRHVAHTLRNQQAALDAWRAPLGVGDDAAVLFEGCGARVALPAAEVRRWLGEYALTWGWTLGPPTDASHGARLLVLKHGRRWSPGAACAARGAD